MSILVLRHKLPPVYTLILLLSYFLGEMGLNFIDNPIMLKNFLGT